MNMVDLYVAEVGRNLPQKNRADLEQEIRSLIEDAIEDAAQTQGRPADEALVVEVLKKFGAPEAMAASYGKPGYLIGPRLYPTFLTVLRIVLAIALAVSAISAGLQLGQSADSGRTIVEVITEVFTVLFSAVFGALVAAFGNVALIFALLERFLPESTWTGDEKEFDPRKLKAEPDADRISIADPVLGVVFTVAFMLVLNVYPHWIGIFSLVDGRWVGVPALTEAFFRYLPFINLLLVADIVRYALMLQQGRWTEGLRWLAVGQKIATVGLLAWMLSGPAVIGFSATDLAALEWNAPVIQRFLEAMPSMVTLSRMVLGLVLALTLWEAGVHLYRIFVRRGSPGTMVLR
jgi:hypothetical protein